MSEADYTPFKRYCELALELVYSDSEMSDSEREIVKRSLDELLAERWRRVLVLGHKTPFRMKHGPGMVSDSRTG